MNPYARAGLDLFFEFVAVAALAALAVLAIWGFVRIWGWG